MDLSSVLNVIAKYSEDLGLNQTNLYMLLFDEADNNPPMDITQTAKNIFSKAKNNRALKQNIMSNIIFEEGDAALCERIRTRWLSKVGGHESLYDELCEQIQSDDFLPEHSKRDLISSCDPSNEAQLSRFITLCIICGNYNTIQQKSKHPRIQEEYAVNVYSIAKVSSYEEQLLWNCSKTAFLASCREGGRFASLNIIQTILPRGYVVEPNFPARYREADGSINPVMDICKSGTENIAIVGEGGIGKTTFLHQLMKEEFLNKNGKERKYKSGCPVPFFIELNRCPEQIREWYNEALGKTNFITRYIGQLFENHSSIDSVDDITLDMIEKEFQRIPEDCIPHYLLLLDGFNEVKSSKGLSVRTLLSNEISVLNTYPNIRIITTSRETQAAYYAADFKNVQLIGLEDHDIKAYFEQSNISEVLIGLYMSNKALLRCLRIPLFLCMFTAERAEELIPETPGEILFHFFHRKSCFYNIRRHAQDTRTNAFNAYQTAFILDFILPYIGWQFEQNDCFSINDTELEALVSDAVVCVQGLCTDLLEVPFQDFDYKAQILLKTAESLYKCGNVNTEGIINCIHGYLGILYQYQNRAKGFGERSRYSFIHHHFRDYFSAIWDVQLLSLLQCINGPLFQGSRGKEEVKPVNCHDFLNTHYWQHHKIEFVSQILMEHRNRPILNPDTGNWYLPDVATDEQKVLERALDFCRELCVSGCDIHYMLQNILSAILQGRKELSGMDLSSLDFKHCCFFNVTCSKKGATETLAANFDGARLYKENFQPETHQDSVIDFVYHKMQCFTLDMDGCIKCWDVLSGKLEYELLSKDPVGSADFSPTGFLKISPDGRFLAVKQQEFFPDGIHVGVSLYDLSLPEKCRIALTPLSDHKKLNSFSFTGDSKGLLMVCDNKTVYGFSLDNYAVRYCFSYEDLLSETQLYADHIKASIYAFTAEYDVYEFGEYDIIYDADDDHKGEDEAGEYMEEDEELPVFCQLMKLSVTDGTSKILYSFNGMPGTMPTAKYIPASDSFLLFNYENLKIEQFFCKSGKVCALFDELTKENDMPPSAIHIHPEHPLEYYFMYPENCYLTSITGARFSILMKYPILGVNKLLSDSDQERELTFKTSVVPVNNRFIVGTDTNVYEWNSEEDTLIFKYNVTYYNCTDLIADPKRSCFFLIHMFNGVSVFAGSPLKLLNSYCFSERDYFIGISCFEPESQLLALNFSREDHEKVVLLNMHTGQQSVCFSTLHKSESICNMCFDHSGEWLLITTQYRCLEYHISSEVCHLIRESSENERLAGAYYLDRYIELAIVEDWVNGSCHVDSHCEFYQRRRMKEKIYYVLKWKYIMPELTEELSPYFIPQHGDLGITGAKTQDGLQEYWVTQGFFLEKERFDIPQLEWYEFVRKRWTQLSKPPVELDFIFFKHVHTISKYRNDDAGFSYTYLSDDGGTAIFLKKSCCLFLHENYRRCTYGELSNGFKKELGSYEGNACWEFAIPWGKSDIVACYENYQLMRLDAATGDELQQVEYTPGLAVCGCSFFGMDGDEELKEELRINGGVL